MSVVKPQRLCLILLVAAAVVATGLPAAAATPPRGEVLTVVDRQVQLIQADGSTPRVIADPESFMTDAAWSPDGTQVAYTVQVLDERTGVDTTALRVVDADGTRDRALFEGPGVAFDWAPDGTQLVVGTASASDGEPALLRSVDADTGMAFEPFASFPPADGVRAGFTGVDASPTTDRVAVTVSDSSSFSSLVLVDRDGGALVTPFLAGTDGTAALGTSWTLDGSRLVYTLVFDRSELRIVAADGSDDRLLLAADGVSAPAVAPDGSAVALVAHAAPDSTTLNDLRVAGFDGRQLTTDPRTVVAPDRAEGAFGSVSWSPDGSALAFVAVEPQPGGASLGAVYSVLADGSELTTLAEGCGGSIAEDCEGTPVTAAFRPTASPVPSPQREPSRYPDSILSCTFTPAFGGPRLGALGIATPVPIGAPVEVLIGVSPGNGQEADIAVAWGDGTVDEQTVVRESDPTDLTFGHTYTEPGRYVVRVTAGSEDCTSVDYPAAVYEVHEPGRPIRLAGATRLETAVELSRQLFPIDGGAEAAVLARSDDYPDALSGATLAAARTASLLLTPPDALAPEVQAELARLLSPGATVYLLGGTAALSPAVEAAVAAQGYRTVRLTGATRLDTAVLVANEATAGRPVEQITYAWGYDFRDPLLGAAYAAVANVGDFPLSALVLVQGPDDLGEPARAFTAAHPDPARGRVAVGPVAVAAATRDLPGIVAVEGPDTGASPEDRSRTEYEATTAALLQQLWPPTRFGAARQFAVASGADFPDALAGGLHAAYRGMPLLLSAPDRFAANVWIVDNGPFDNAWLYGGTAALSPAVADGIAEHLQGPQER